MIRSAVTAVVLLTCSTLAMAGEALTTPYKFIDMPVKDAAASVGVTPNATNNVVLDDAGRHVSMESTGNTIEMVDIELRDLPKCKQSSAFDGQGILRSMSINPGQLELAINQTDNQVYYDHQNKVKIGISCAYDGAPLNVSFSRKQYMVLTGMRQ